MSLSELLRFALIANAVSFAFGFIGEGLGEWRTCRRQRRIAELGKQLRTQTEQLKAQVLEDRIRREQAKFTGSGFDASAVDYGPSNTSYADNVCCTTTRLTEHKPVEPEPFGTVERK